MSLWQISLLESTAKRMGLGCCDKGQSSDRDVLVSDTSGFLDSAIARIKAGSRGRGANDRSHI